MNQLGLEKRCRIVTCLVEGNSIRATCRLTGAAKNTVVKLLRDVGEACERFQDRAMRNLPCKRLECGEIRTFVYSKGKNVPADKLTEKGIGDVWTWTAIDAETKVIPSWMIGGRDAGTGTAFMRDLTSRLTNRVQLTTDGRHAYLNGIADAFGDNIDYAMLVKLYGPEGNPNKPETKYSPGKCNGSRRRKIVGNLMSSLVSTSYAERANLQMRVHMHRLTRLTNGFSKKIENLAHAIGLHFMYYNFCLKHGTLGCTPAQAIGIARQKWSVEDVIGLIESKGPTSNIS